MKIGYRRLCARKGMPHVGFVTYAVPKGFLSTRKWKLIAVTNSEATGKAMAPPDAQIVADVVPGCEAMPVWMAIGAPANLPRPIVMRLNEAIAKAQAECRRALRGGQAG